MKQYRADTQRMWQLATKATYKSTDYGWLAVREAFQNSLDAVNKALRYGEIEHGEIDVSYSTEDNTLWEIVIKDNGVGMKADGKPAPSYCADLDDIYLNLGGTDKKDGTTVGGFGIGKAVILGCCQRWEIRTRDTYADSDLLGKTKKWGTVPYEQGTEITLHGVTLTYSSNIRRCLQYSEWDTRDITVRLDGEELSPELKIKPNHRSWEYEDEKNIVYINVLPKIYPRIIYRFNGLYQTDEYLWNVKDFALLVDVHSDAIPGEDDFPFDTSREEVRGEVKRFVNKISEQVKNNQQVAKAVDEYMVSNYHGSQRLSDENRAAMDRLLKGKLAKEFRSEDSMVAEVRDIVNALEKLDERIFQGVMRNSSVISTIVDEDDSPLDIDFIIQKHRSYKGNIWNDKLFLRKLIVWEIICHSLISYSTRGEGDFTVGVILESKIDGMYFREDGIDYVLFNPGIFHGTKDRRLKLARIVDVAAHELAHYLNCPQHDESFVQKRDIMFRKGLELIPSLIKDVRIFDLLKV